MERSLVGVETSCDWPEFARAHPTAYSSIFSQYNPMNAPDRHELLVVPEGQKKLEMKKDTRIPNAATFTIQREDHTIGNLLRAYLHCPVWVEA